MKTLASAPPPAREDRPATQLLHDEENARVVSFHLLADQEVAPHRSSSTVLVQVVEGEGVFRGEGDETHLVTGDTAVFAPGEMHSMRPVGGPLRFLAIITPRPS
jgi:quercetin dioxygenase-like cupin family protein